MSEIYQQKFSSIERLYGRGSLERLQNSHVCVVGLGGVGSWVVEGLVRSGVGTITLIDFDDICVSNFNRQIHATAETVGQLKSKALKARMLQINGELSVKIKDEALSKENVDQVLKQKYDFIVDAMDDVWAKCELLSKCYKTEQKLICVGGAGGKRASYNIQVKDLSKVTGDRLLKNVKHTLKRHYGLRKSPGKNLNLPCVYTPDSPLYLQPDGSMTEVRPTHLLKPLDCSSGMGTAVHVTANLGFMATNYVVDKLVLG